MIQKLSSFKLKIGSIEGSSQTEPQKPVVENIKVKESFFGKLKRGLSEARATVKSAEKKAENSKRVELTADKYNNTKGGRRLSKMTTSDGREVMKMQAESAIDTKSNKIEIGLKSKAAGLKASIEETANIGKNLGAKAIEKAKDNLDSGMKKFKSLDGIVTNSSTQIENKLIADSQSMAKNIGAKFNSLNQSVSRSSTEFQNNVSDNLKNTLASGVLKASNAAKAAGNRVAYESINTVDRVYSAGENTVDAVKLKFAEAKQRFEEMQSRVRIEKAIRAQKVADKAQKLADDLKRKASK